MSDLIIDRKSWHFQFINRYSDYSPPNDLCRYVRKIVVILFVTTGMGVAVGFIAMAILASWWALFRYYILGIPNFDGFFGEANAVVFTMLQIAGLLITIGVLIGKRIRRWWEKRRETYIAPPPGIFKLWWKAHKAKICPMLSFTQL